MCLEELSAVVIEQRKRDGESRAGRVTVLNRPC